MPANPVISIIVPAYNRAHSLADTLRSLLAQTFTDFEIIVVDDGSTDNTVAVARSFGERVQVVTQKNSGASVARNNGIRRARGEWIAFQDSDDLWQPEKLQRQMDVLQKHGGDWCATQAVDVRGKALENFGCPTGTKIEPAVKLVLPLDRRTVLPSRHPCVQSMLLRKNLVEKIGPFDAELFVAEDTEFVFRASLLAGMLYLDEPLVVIFETTENSLTRNIDPKIRERRFDSYCRAQEKIFDRLVALGSPQKKQARVLLGYFSLSRAELACIAGDFSLARQQARKAMGCGGSVRVFLRSAAIWCWPTRWQNWYQKKWEGQNV